MRLTTPYERYEHCCTVSWSAGSYIIGDSHGDGRWRGPARMPVFDLLASPFYCSGRSDHTDRLPTGGTVQLCWRLGCPHRGVHEVQYAARDMFIKIKTHTTWDNALMPWSKVMNGDICGTCCWVTQRPVPHYHFGALVVCFLVGWHV